MTWEFLATMFLGGLGLIMFASALAEWSFAKRIETGFHADSARFTGDIFMGTAVALLTTAFAWPHL